MKVIIAGSRDGIFLTRHFEYLENVVMADLEITEVVHGGARGIDSYAGEWAKVMGFPVKVFEADWVQHGTPAGPIRNKQMAEYADAVVLFAGGRGTASMMREATKAGIKILDATNL